MDARTLLPHVSREVLRHLAGDRAAGVERFSAAFVFFDVSGFTRLSDRLAQQGQGGVETLNRVLSGILGPLADSCDAAGGDVLFFAGDGVGVLFRPLDGEALGATARRAVHTAAGVVDAIGHRELEPGISLQVRAAVGVGRCIGAPLGGIDGRRLAVVDGPAVQQAHQADRVAAPGAVMVSKECWRLLGEGFTGEPVGGGVQRLTHRPSTLPIPQVPPRHLPEDQVSAVTPYLSKALLHGLQAGTEAWLAELRPVVSLFVSLPGVTVADPLLQRAVEVAQTEMARVEGTLHAVIGDKGLGLLCALGLPPRAHEDDVVRGIEAAMAIRDALAEEGLEVGIGLELGKVHCGVVGSPERRQYDLYGASLSLAARLMQAAEGSGILVGPAAREAASGRFEFGLPEPLALKGFADRVMASRPLARRHGRRRGRVDMVGRTDLLTHLAGRIELADERPRVVFIEAEAGMGKSMLLDQLLSRRMPEGTRLLYGAADSMESQTSLYAFRTVVADLFGLEHDSPRATVRERVLARVEELVPDKAVLAPLLDVVLPLDLPDNELTGQLSPGVRAENLADLLLALFRAFAAEGAIVLVVEDLHWVDGASWSVLATLADHVPGLLILGTLRPMDAPPPQLAPLVEGEGRGLVRLQALGRVQTGRIVARSLGVDTVSPEVIDAVHARSEGVPFYSEEVAYALRDAGALRITDGRCELGDPRAAVELPSNVTGVITGRIDRLPAPIQLSLKVASVLGRYFTLAALVAVHPLTATADVCEAHARQLVDASLVTEQEDTPGRYFFRHALTHETAYGLLTPSQRKSLHRAAAEQIEADRAEDLGPWYNRLAEHWRLAEDRTKAAHFAGLAGEQAIETYASRTAIRYLEQALQLDEGARDVQAIDLKRARWHRLMGEAWYSVPDPDKARHHLEEAYVLSGFQRPRFGWRTPVEVFKHIFGRYTTPAAPSDPLRERCLSALKAFDSLSVVCLWSGDRFGLVHVVFASDNLGRASGASPEAALARNMVGYSLVLAGLREIGERDMRRAFAMAEQVNDLYARIATHVFLGLTMSLLARVDEARPLLEEGWRLSREMGGGLWRHRADYMLGECLDISGRYAEAIPYFRSCAEIARGAEPHTVGFANATAVLCELRLGGDPVALLPQLESPDDGVPQTRKEKGYAMQVGVAVGVQQEVLLRLGRYAEAWALALEMMDLVESGDDTYSYFRGSYCHTQTAICVHALWERRLAGQQGLQDLPEAAELGRQAKRALGHLKRGFKTFPAVESKYRLFEGIHHRIAGAPERARKALAQCLAFSEQASFPWEQVVAHVELARLSDGDERAQHANRAREIADAYGLVWEISDTPSVGIGSPLSPT